MRLLKQKKGQVFGSLQELAIGIASLVIIFAVVFLLLANTRTQIVEMESISLADNRTWTAAYNGTVELTEAAEDVPGWIPLVVITVIGSVLISLVALFRQGK